MIDALYHVNALGERLEAPNDDSRTYGFHHFDKNQGIQQLVEHQGADRILKGAMIAKADDDGWLLWILDERRVLRGTHNFTSFDEALKDTLKLAALGVLDLAE